MRRIIIMVAGFVVVGLSMGVETSDSAQNSQQQTESLSSDEHDAAIRRGEQIYKRMQKQLPIDENPQVRGQMTKVPTLALFITNKMWNSLTKEQKIDYTWYAESLISSVRSDPQKYVGIPESAPLYRPFLEKTRNLCADCWEVIVGDPARTEGELTLTVDKVVVQGDTPWQAGDPCCRGVKASDFRN